MCHEPEVLLNEILREENFQIERVACQKLMRGCPVRSGSYVKGVQRAHDVALFCKWLQTVLDSYDPSCLEPRVLGVSIG